jgi:hypothetical protein
MSRNHTSDDPHPSGVLIPVNDALQHVHEPVAIEHPTGVLRPHCLAELAKLLRRFPTGGSLRVYSERRFEVLVGAESVAGFERVLAQLHGTLCAPPLAAVGSTDELEFHYPEKLLSMRQLFALAALAHVEGAAAVRFGASPGTAFLVGVPGDRHRSIAGELAEFGFTV